MQINRFIEFYLKLNIFFIVNITNEIVKCIEKHGISKTQINVVGSDGTNVNTGSKGGVITLLEKYLGHTGNF